MRRKTWLEGLLLLAISLMSLAESIRLIVYKDPTTLYDPLGPGWYLLLVSIGLATTAVVHIEHHLKQRSSPKEERTSREMTYRFVGTCVSCLAYIVLINIVGYAIASLIFFVMMFRVVRVKLWVNLVLSIFLTGAYYLIFIRYCSIIFPEGILF